MREALRQQTHCSVEKILRLQTKLGVTNMHQMFVPMCHQPRMSYRSYMIVQDWRNFQRKKREIRPTSKKKLCFDQPSVSLTEELAKAVSKNASPGQCNKCCISYILIGSATMKRLSGYVLRGLLTILHVSAEPASLHRQRATVPTACACSVFPMTLEPDMGKY